MTEGFLLERHLQCLERHLSMFPYKYISMDSNRVTLLFFTVSALDVIGKVDEVIDADAKQTYIDWIYRLQLTVKSGTH